MKRVTQMSQPRFAELRKGMIDGSLKEKWEHITTPTKADKVEDRQIRAIAQIFCDGSDATTRLLLSGNWKELEIVDDNGIYKVRVY